MSGDSSDGHPASYLRRYSPSPNRDPDAGLRALSHYERKLPKLRYKLRQWLIPIVRWETPYLARVQNACRSPFLDSYFAFTANLGTHTFFMTFLPICFWCGYPDIGLSLVHMLALGVYLSGALKDLVCLPRPLSPPLQRITMSGSAALEYGFPSTHTTNAVSVAVFGLHQLYLSKADWSSTSYNLMRIGCYSYATSITLGRMYCGMHGFFDIVIGALLGAFIAWLRIAFGSMFDLWILQGSWTNTCITVLGLASAIRFHPEPADDCPCFDDSVAFLGVVMGISVGIWQRALQYDISTTLLPLSGMFPYSNHNLLKVAGRMIGGIVVIFLWRAVMKPLLLRLLPPLFRFIDHWGVNMPRRYFLQAKEYTKVPPLRKDDNIIPPAADIPSMLMSIHNPRRRRISVGPQSEADARELLANREQRRRENRSAQSPERKQTGHILTTGGNQRPSSTSEEASSLQVPALPTQAAHSAVNQSLERTSKPSLSVNSLEGEIASNDGTKEDESNDRKIFSALEKPRTHYDVEVITKLVVYAGIAWLTVEGNPVLFEHIRLV